MDKSPSKVILPVIVFSQFFCTSIWFAGNAILNEIIQTFHLGAGSLANLTSSVQFGFIAGTLVFALLTIADRYSPSKVFFVSSVLAALCNVGVTLHGIDSNTLLAFRFLTGFFLAGIYPVGMKIASDHYQKGLGKSLGFLVGALVLGTGFPHLLKSFATNVPWKAVVYTTSGLSLAGGSAMLWLVPDGPLRKRSQRLDITAFMTGFSNRDFRAASLGYFGHMWEVYAFWAFVPVMLINFGIQYTDIALNVPLWSFIVIASGGLGCVIGGILSQRVGPKRIATLALFLSGLCCLTSPVFLSSSSTVALLIFLCFWGLVVAADSPLFSTLVALNAADESRGSALTIMNCIGFTVTIIAIQVTSMLAQYIPVHLVFVVLAAGPVFGVAAMIDRKKPAP